MAESERLRGSRSPVVNYKVGDGSVKDLFRYIMGDELPVKKFGRNKKGTAVKKNDTNAREIITNGVRGSIEATARNPFGASKTQFVETDPPPVTKWQGPRAPVDKVTIEGPPPRNNIEYGPYEDMEFYRTGTPDSAEGLRGIQKSSPINSGGMYMAPPTEEDGRNYIGEFGKGYGNVGQQTNELPSPIDALTHVARKIGNAIYNFGGLLNAPSTKQIVMAVGPDNISAEENAEIDEVKYYLDRYPEIMALARKLKRPPTDQEIIAIIQEYEKGGRLKPNKEPYKRMYSGGRVRPKKKRKKRLSKGGKVTSYNY